MTATMPELIACSRHIAEAQPATEEGAEKQRKMTATDRESFGKLKARRCAGVLPRPQRKRRRRMTGRPPSSKLA